MCKWFNYSDGAFSLLSIKIGDVDSIALKKARRWLPLLKIRILPKNKNCVQFASKEDGVGNSAVTIVSENRLVKRITMICANNEENRKVEKFRKLALKALEICQSHRNEFDGVEISGGAIQSCYTFGNSRNSLFICIQDMKRGADYNIFIIEIKAIKTP